MHKLHEFILVLTGNYWKAPVLQLYVMNSQKMKIQGKTKELNSDSKEFNEVNGLNGKWEKALLNSFKDKSHPTPIIIIFDYNQDFYLYAIPIHNCFMRKRQVEFLN